MSGSSSQEPTSQTITNNPPDYLAPYLTSAADNAQRLYAQGGGYSYYPNSTVVPFDDATTQALNLTQQRAIDGSPVSASAQQNALSTLNGDYLNGNPYLDNAIDIASRGVIRNYTDAVAPSIDAGFARGGRYGSGLHANAQDAAQENLGQELGDIASGMAYQNYGDERARMSQITSLAPTLAAQDYTDLQQLSGVGTARENLAAQYLQEDIDRYNYQNNAQRMALDEYISRLSGAGATSFSNQSVTAANAGSRSNPLTGAIGGGLSGAAAGATIGSAVPVLGTGIGALIGGGLGMLGGGFA